MRYNWYCLLHHFCHVVLSLCWIHWHDGSFLAPSEVTSLRSITQNSNSILIQWGLPDQPNGTITSYIVRIGNADHTIRSDTFFFSFDGNNPGDTISFTIYAEIDGADFNIPDIDGVMSDRQQTLNTTVPFPEAQLIENSIGTLTISLPPANLYPDDYGDIVWAVLLYVIQYTLNICVYFICTLLSVNWGRLITWMKLSFDKCWWFKI